MPLAIRDGMHRAWLVVALIGCHGFRTPGIDDDSQSDAPVGMIDAAPMATAPKLLLEGTALYPRAIRTAAGTILVSVVTPLPSGRMGGTILASSDDGVSFAVIGHIATRIMGIEPDAPGHAVTTLGRLPPEVAWAQLDHVPVGPNDLLVRHEDGNRTTTVANHAGPDVAWEALFRGAHPVVRVDGAIAKASTREIDGAPVTGITVRVEAGQRRTVSVR